MGGLSWDCGWKQRTTGSRKLAPRSKIPLPGEPPLTPPAHAGTTRPAWRPERDEEEGLAAAPSIGRATAVEPNAPAPETEAAHGLYERHYASVLRFCRRRLGTREEAEDAAQTTFCYALGGLRRGVVPASETAWLLTIARNVCLNRWDAARRRGRVEIARDPQLLQEVAPGRPDSGVAVTDLDEALRKLPEQQRRAILLREWQGLSYADIATELGVSRSAVETLIFRARKALVRELGGERTRNLGFDVGSLLTALKSLLAGGGATVKIAAGAAAVAAAGALAVPTLERELRGPESPPAARTGAATPASARAAGASEVLTTAVARRVPSRRGAAASSVSPATRDAHVQSAGGQAARKRPVSPPAPSVPTPRKPGPAHPPAAAPDRPGAPAADVPPPRASSPQPPSSSPGASAPPALAPPVAVPTVDVPAVDVPAVDVPPVDVPPVDVPVLPPVDLPPVDVPAVDVPAVDVPPVRPVNLAPVQPPPLPKLP
jgi:RNA polymerase sigma factor (sigma-70 family)